MSKQGTQISQTFLYIAVILILILLPVETIVSQDHDKPVYEDSIHLTVKHHKHNKTKHINNQRITNVFIKAFSKSIPKILGYTSFSIHWQHQAFISDKAIHTELKGMHIRGHKTYRDFLIQKFLTPDQIKCKYEFTHNDKGLTITDTINIANNQKNTLFPDESIKPENLNLDSFHYQLVYKEKQKKDFLRYTQAIDQYYKDFPRLKEALVKVGGISFDNLNMLPIYSANLKEAENTLENLKERSYLNLLNLEQNDPLDFLPRFKNLRIGIAFKREKINNQLKNRDRLYYQEGLNYLDSDTAISRSYFEKAIQTNTFFTPAYLELAKLDLNNGQLNSSAERIEYVLQELKPDTQTYRKIITFNDSLVQGFIDSAKKLIENENFNQAVNVMERAKEFCHNTPEYECSSEVDKTLSNARYGIYNAYISVVRKALERKKPEMALEYIKRVNHYQKENSQSIISTNTVKDLYTSVAGLFAEQAQKILDSEKYEKALSHLKKADELCKSEDCKSKINTNLSIAYQGIYEQQLKKADNAFQQENFNKAKHFVRQADEYLQNHKDFLQTSLQRDTLKEEIDYKIYRKNLKKGYQLLSYDKPETALKKFMNAKNLLSQYDYKKNDTIDSLIRVSAKPVILSEINKGKLKVWGEKFSEARDILDKTRSNSKKYLLTDNEQIQDSIKVFESKLRMKFCQSIQDTLKHYKEQADLSMSKANYLLARQNFKKIISKASEYEQCSFEIKSVKQKLSDNQPIFKYTEMQQELDSLLKEKEYKALIRKIENMQKYFDNKNLQEEGLKDITLLYFCNKHYNPELKQYIIKWYLKRNKGYKALGILQTFNRQKTSPESVKELQKEIGKAIAKQDVQEDETMDYKKQAQKLAAGSWYNFFRSAYKSEFRKKAGIFPFFF